MPATAPAVNRRFIASTFPSTSAAFPLPNRPPTGIHATVLELQRMVLLDTSGLDALQHLHRSLQGQGVVLVLAEVNELPLSLIRR